MRQTGSTGSTSRKVSLKRACVGVRSTLVPVHVTAGRHCRTCIQSARGVSLQPTQAMPQVCAALQLRCRSKLIYRLMRLELRGVCSEAWSEVSVHDRLRLGATPAPCTAPEHQDDNARYESQHKSKQWCMHNLEDICRRLLCCALASLCTSIHQPRCKYKPAVGQRHCCARAQCASQQWTRFAALAERRSVARMRVRWAAAARLRSRQAPGCACGLSGSARAGDEPGMPSAWVWSQPCCKRRSLRIRCAAHCLRFTRARHKLQHRDLITLNVCTVL